VSGICTDGTGGDNGGTGNNSGDGSGSNTDIAAVAPLNGLQLRAPCQGSASGNLCHADGDPINTLFMNGDATRIYQVKIHVQGVAELSVFQGGMAVPPTNWYVGDILGTRDDNTSDFSLAVSDPSQIYHLNSASTNSTGVVHIDYTVTFPIAGDASVLVNIDTGDGMEAINLGSDGNPITISGVTTSPSPYDGQFIQIDVESAE
jgi:hypothetical protein